MKYHWNTRLQGRQSEKIAGDFLEKRGWQIIERNYQVRDGEIDIIAIDKSKVWHFIEVKSKRLNSLFGLPEEAVNSQKQRKIIKAVEYYLLKRKMADIPISLDVLALDFNDWGRVVRIALFTGAFEERN